MTETAIASSVAGIDQRWGHRGWVSLTPFTSHSSGLSAGLSDGHPDLDAIPKPDGTVQPGLLCEQTLTPT